MNLASDIYFSLYLRYGIKMGAACMLAALLSYAIGAPFSVWANVDPRISMELRILGNAPPDLARGLTFSAEQVETKLARLRRDGSTQNFGLHKVVQIYTFYQAPRLLAEALLIALEHVENKARGKNNAPS